MLTDEKLQDVLNAASKRAGWWGHRTYDPMHILIEMYLSEKNAVYPILNKYGFNKDTASIIANEVRKFHNPLYKNSPSSTNTKSLLYSAFAEVAGSDRGVIRVSSMDVFQAMLEHRPRCPDVIKILTAFAPLSAFREEAYRPVVVRNQVTIEEV